MTSLRVRVGWAAVALAAACQPADQPAEARTTNLAAALREAETIYWTSDFDSAVALLDEVAADARDEGDYGALAKALTWNGLAHWRLVDFESAIRIGEEALARRAPARPLSRRTRGMSAQSSLLISASRRFSSWA